MKKKYIIPRSSLIKMDIPETVLTGSILTAPTLGVEEAEEDPDVKETELWGD